ncbi:MAG: hypothetical protein JXR96_04405 [Deltaproteobacteria bacterium]|nr:hypothetical protein [Deltaproteobacteria bacterium]
MREDSRRSGASGAVLVGIAGVLLCWMGFHNGFPLVFYDTAAYLRIGFAKILMPGRPVFYGLFVWIASLGQSPYLVILFQGLLVSYLVYLLFRSLFAPSCWKLGFLSAIVFVCLTTAASFSVSQMQVDAFTPILFLSLALFLFDDSLSTAERVGAAAVYAFSLTTHNTHILIVGIALVAILLMWSNRRSRGWIRERMRRRWVVAWGLFGLALIMMPTVHYVMGNRFVVMYGSHSFIMQKLLDYGVLDAYLEESCQEKRYGLCEYAGHIPDNFMWDMKNSPFYKMGGWDATEEEYSRIIRDVLSDPGYLAICAYNSIGCSAKMLVNFDIDFVEKTDYLESAVRECFGGYERQYRNARQQMGSLKVEHINTLQRFAVFVSLLLAFFAFFHPEIRARIPARTKGVVLFLLAAIFLNAVVCGTLGLVLARYQNRVTWIVVLMAIWLYSPREVAGYLVKRARELSAGECRPD